MCWSLLAKIRILGRSSVGNENNNYEYLDPNKHCYGYAGNGIIIPQTGKKASIKIYFGMSDVTDLTIFYTVYIESVTNDAITFRLVQRIPLFFQNA